MQAEVEAAEADEEEEKLSFEQEKTLFSNSKDLVRTATAYKDLAQLKADADVTLNQKKMDILKVKVCDLNGVVLLCFSFWVNLYNLIFVWFGFSVPIGSTEDKTIE